MRYSLYCIHADLHSLIKSFIRFYHHSIFNLFLSAGGKYASMRRGHGCFRFIAKEALLREGTEKSQRKEREDK